MQKGIEIQTANGKQATFIINPKQGFAWQLKPVCAAHIVTHERVEELKTLLTAFTQQRLKFCEIKLRNPRESERFHCPHNSNLGSSSELQFRQAEQLRLNRFQNCIAEEGTSL